MTEKNVKLHLKAIWSSYDRLQKALNRAHFAKVINYECGGDTGLDWSDVAPCSTMEELQRRIRETTKDASAEAMEKSVRKR